MVSVRTRSVTVTKAGLVPSVISFAVIIAVMVSMVSVTTGHVTVEEDGMANIVPLVSKYAVNPFQTDEIIHKAQNKVKMVYCIY